MAKNSESHNRPWTARNDRKLRQEAAHNTPARVIGIHVCRTEESI